MLLVLGKLFQGDLRLDRGAMLLIIHFAPLYICILCLYYNNLSVLLRIRYQMRMRHVITP